MSKLAHVSKDAFVACEEFEIAKLTLGLSCFWQLMYVELCKLKIFEILVYKTVTKILFVSALTVLGVVVGDNLIHVAAVRIASIKVH